MRRKTKAVWKQRNNNGDANNSDADIYTFYSCDFCDDVIVILMMMMM